MRILDLFCGAGGTAMGYHRAGFEVVGVDLTPQPNYPLMFVQGDALEFLARNWRHFDAFHASPPCQSYSPLRALAPHKSYPDLIDATRAALIATARPFVMENVMTAPLDAQRSIRLCGGMFGLRTYRHRRFESGGGLVLTPHPHPAHVARTATKRRRELWNQGWHVSITGDVGTYCAVEAMGIDWMNGNELCEAIPPAYAEFVGTQIVSHLKGVA